MPKLVDKDICCGCGACCSICHQDALHMRADNFDGFLYPEIEMAKCVECGLCEKVCPVRHVNKPRTPLVVYAAKANNETIRMQSSSGGIFPLLARSFLEEGGYVFGAAFDHKHWHVSHRFVDNVTDLNEICGSKYVQSDMNECYRQVAQMLANNKKVLFSGTPCQIAALKLFLKASSKSSLTNLLLVDVVCHAVPSPLAWTLYLKKRCAGRCVKRISFRNKKGCGWKKYSLHFNFTDGTEYSREFNQDPFMRGFLSELYNRQSCHHCSFKSLKSDSDLTVADYWGIGSLYPDMDDDKGTSLVMLSTQLGRAAFQRIVDLVSLKESDFKHAAGSQCAIMSSTIPHKNRGCFFARVHLDDFDQLVNDLLKPSFIGLLVRSMKKLVKRIVFR